MLTTPSLPPQRRPHRRPPLAPLVRGEEQPLEGGEESRAPLRPPRRPDRGDRGVGVGGCGGGLPPLPPSARLAVAPVAPRRAPATVRPSHRGRPVAAPDPGHLICPPRPRSHRQGPRNPSRFHLPPPLPHLPRSHGGTRDALVPGERRVGLRSHEVGEAFRDLAETLHPRGARGGGGAAGDAGGAACRPGLGVGAEGGGG